MKEERGQLAAPQGSRIRLETPIGHGARGFLAFLICCAVLIAAFAAWRIWQGDPVRATPVTGTDGTNALTDPSGSLQTPSMLESLPSGTVPIRDTDLSGEAFRNLTSHTVDPAAVRALVGGDTRSFVADQPIVLVLHTHAQECYRSDDKNYLSGVVGDEIYSEDTETNVIAAGEALCRELTRNGVPTIHCTAMHGESGTLNGAYASAAACIRTYLERYPTIEYVIDLQRDCLLAADGACLRTASPDGSAQIVAIVGSDGDGTDCPSWRSNLGLALCLFDRLNAEKSGICRPVELRNATYNQELAPYALLLEIGSAGNRVDEAVESAKLVGKALADLICNRPSA